MKYLIDPDHFSAPVTQMKISVSRRGLLAAAADAAEERHRSRNGLPSYRIEDLSTYSDEELADLFPIVNNKAKISLEKGTVYAETFAAVDPIALFDVNSPALFIFNQFNGLQPLSKICEKVAAHTGWEPEKARRIVRMVFLKLCEVRVCEPGNAD